MSADLVRETLCRMIGQHGRSLGDDPRRVEGLLRDLCPKDRREVNLLIGALREGVASELTASVTNAAPAAAIERLARKLEQNLGMTPDAARWAVETWAIALSVIAPQPMRLQATVKPPEETKAVPKLVSGGDHYQNLGVSRNASPAEIESAFRNILALVRDSTLRAEDAAMTKRVATEAYEVLSDPEKRSRYDRFGLTGFVANADIALPADFVNQAVRDIFGDLLRPGAAGKQELPRPSARPVGEVLRLPGHTNAVRSVAFSPDGQLMASGSDDNTVLIWDCHSGQPLKKYTGYRAGLAFALGPRRIFWACQSAVTNYVVFQCIDTANANPDRWLPLALKDFGSVFSPATNPVTASALASDGSFLFAGDSVGCWKVWETSTEKQLLEFEPGWFAAKPRMLCAVSFFGSSVGALVAAGYEDHTIRLWELRSGKEIRQFQGHQHGVQSVAFSADGRRLLSAGGDDMTVRLWDVNTGVEMRRLTGHTGSVRAVAFSPDGRRALSGSGSFVQNGFFSTSPPQVIDPSLRLWDLDTGRQLGCFDTFASPVWSVAFSPDGQQALFGSGHRYQKSLWFGTEEPIDCTVRLWNLPQSK